MRVGPLQRPHAATRATRGDGEPHCDAAAGLAPRLRRTICFDGTNSLQRNRARGLASCPRQQSSCSKPTGVHRVRRELEDWRRRLRLAYARQWDWRAREICKMEIRRLGDLARDIAREHA